MGKKLTEKILGWLGFEYEDDDLDEEKDLSYEGAVPLSAKGSMGNVVNLHSVQNMKIVIVKPVSFEQVQEFAVDLKNRRPIVINLEGADKETAQRIIDFMSGAVFALGGTMQKINPCIFIFAPNNVNIDGASTDDIKQNVIFAQPVRPRPS